MESAKQLAEEWTRPAARRARPRGGRGPTLRACALGATLALAAFAAGAQTPPPAKWDQARVTDIALKLRDATKELYVEALKVPDRPPGSARRAQYMAREDLRQMNNMARRLASQLKDGKGRDETEGIYTRLQQKRRDAENEGRKIDIGQPVLDKIAPVSDLLRQIAPYYEDAMAPAA